MDTKDSEPMAITWIEQLDREQIPYSQYFELYTRCIGLRARRIEQGLKCDDFSVDMMIACWPNLQRELKQKEIDQGRTLPNNAESVCPKCFGSGFELYREGQYQYTRKCQHG